MGTGSESWIEITGSPPPATGTGPGIIAFIALNVFGFLLWS